MRINSHQVPSLSAAARRAAVCATDAICATRCPKFWVILPPELQSGAPRPNTQTTTIVFGELYVHAFSSVFGSIAVKAGISDDGIEKIAQIWPTREEFIVWPPNPMTDRDADNIAGEIAAAIELAGRGS